MLNILLKRLQVKIYGIFTTNRSQESLLEYLAGVSFLSTDGVFDRLDGYGKHILMALNRSVAMRYHDLML